MKKTDKVVMLSTEKSNLLLIDNNSLQQVNKEVIGASNSTPQHLYIISDEEIKEPCWAINKNQDTLFYIEHNIDSRTNDDWKKVIASTDKSLYIKKTYDDASNDFDYKVLLPELNESFIQAYIKSYNEGNSIIEVDLEYEYNKLYPMVENNNIKLKTRKDNTVICHTSKSFINNESWENIIADITNKLSPKTCFGTIQYLKDNYHPPKKK